MVNSTYHNSPLQLIATIWVMACSAAFFLYAIANPLAEWDMLAYYASVEALSNGDPYTIHDTVYGELESRVSAEKFEEISNGNHYRSVMHQDPLAFYEQIPFYSIRISFNSLLEAVHRFGVSVYDAGHWVSATAFVFSLLLLWGALNDRIHPVMQMMFPIMFYKYTMELDVVRQILADSLASIWVVFMCMAYLRKSSLLLPVIALSVLVRVDLIIFSGLLLLLLMATEGKQRFLSLSVCGAVLLACFLAVQNWAGSYGWHTLYYFAIISDMMGTHPSVYGEIGFTLEEYLRATFLTERWISKMYVLTVALALLTMIFWKSGQVTGFNRRMCRVSGICLLYIAIHYMIFPQMYFRFFVSQNLIIFAGFAVLCTHFWQVYVGTVKQPEISTYNRGQKA